MSQAGFLFQSRPQTTMQAQGHVGIFGSLGAGLFQRDLIEAQLLGALAGHILELNSAQPQMPFRQRVQIMPGGGIQHISCLLYTSRCV